MGRGKFLLEEFKRVEIIEEKANKWFVYLEYKICEMTHLKETIYFKFVIVLAIVIIINEKSFITNTKMQNI